jgi:hypothetical protein
MAEGGPAWRTTSHNALIRSNLPEDFECHHSRTLHALPSAQPHEIPRSVANPKCKKWPKCSYLQGSARSAMKCAEKPGTDQKLDSQPPSLGHQLTHADGARESGVLALRGTLLVQRPVFPALLG